MCNTAMEWEFCWHSKDTFEGIGEFELIVLSYMWKLPWSMTINTRILQSH